MTAGTVENLRHGWVVTSAPCQEQVAWAESSGRLFATQGWANVLASLDAECAFAWHAELGAGVVVPVFRRMGIRIGFLGFPISGPVFDALDAEEAKKCAVAIASLAKVDLVRLTQSQRVRCVKGCTSARPEAWIDNLQAWTLADHKRLRKDIAYAKRSATGITLVEHDFDVYACFELYAAAVSRHGGTVKYTTTYFSALYDLAQRSPLLNFVAAVDGDRVCGFSVLAIDGGVGNYLHSAVDDAARRQGVSDLLLQSLVDKARDAGCERFSLMASPWDQPGLMRFKQKWGKALGLAVTHDVGCSTFGRCVALVSYWQRRHDRRAAIHFARRLEPGSGAANE